MNFIFWQNIISPHQSFIIRSLSNCHNVCLIVEKEIEEDRLRQGWVIPYLGKVKVVLISDTDAINALLSNGIDYHHIFIGINSYPSLYKYFKKIIVNKKVNIISESCIEMGYKKWVRLLKYRILAFRYNNDIENIFAMGDLGVNWYKKTGFNPNKIHNFQYTIESPRDLNLRINEFNNNDHFCRFTFIGQLIYRKGIDNLIKALSKVSNFNWHLDIIGDGDMKWQIVEMIVKLNLNNKITLHGVKNNDDAMTFLTVNTDCLILPSRYDGWGTVVNEALIRGVKVITNEKCGASCMIKNKFWGVVYKEGDNRGLINAIEIIMKEKSSFAIKEKSELSKLYFRENQEKILKNFVRKFISDKL